MSNENWLASHWRPILMSLFGIIIFNNYILDPWLGMLLGISIAAPIPTAMWDLLKLGVSGFVVGRTVEKGITAWKNKAPDTNLTEGP